MFMSSRRLGMTLIELLAVIAIIGLLVAMLLPAVQSARETARLRACSNNIRQVAHAILAHDQSQGRFPMGSINNPPFWGGPRQSWFPYVLPFIESQNVVTSYDFNAEPYGANSNSLTKGPNIPVAVFLCPADTGPQQLAMPYGYLSLGNYPVFFSGSNLGESNPATLPPTRRAAFGFNFGARAANIRDGASNTMILGEYLRSTGEMAGDGTDQRGMLWQADEPGGGHILTGATPNSTTPDIFYPIWWCVNRPDRNQACVNGSTSGNDHTAAARSRHVGGVSIARADGSTAFVADGIDLAVWRGMATIAGGEILPGE
jgi:prepilin-type N-terminal cleavage/methylation domain-containing protein